MKAMIICSLKSLAEDYNDLVWLRNKLIGDGYVLFEDWINYKVELIENKPKFKQKDGDDYLKTAIEGIHKSNIVIFFLTCNSAYIFTILKYALYLSKNVIVIYNKKILIDKLKSISSIKSKILYIKKKEIKKFNYFLSKYEKNIV